ncbi:potassium channel LctB [Halobacillus alkaliphilus]|uniref:Potassium channel LctB n=1 Tax=Halobacillus alkaliphilus TaxID=396056 RepID=A0A1I2QVA7_9BACI|nr:potassium channel family protein [Halobacillus alkaliphilus]SFG30197.1 potassium channel LctB [Halobacillus alkaliphilus]
MIIIAITTVSLILIAGSLRQIFASLEFEHKIFSFQLFLSILLLYTIVMIGFAIIYVSLIEHGVMVYQEGGQFELLHWKEEIARSMYFSGATLFTVGYGEMVPVGVGRWIAILEAMIGYSLPAALVAKVWQHYKIEH